MQNRYLEGEKGKLGFMDKTRKVALMTWYMYQNYGSALQASALYQVVSDLGFDPAFIQYAPKGSLRETAETKLLKRLVNKIDSFKNRPYESCERSKLYEEYLIQKVSCTDQCVSYPELYALNKQYDAFICGSDQIWSPICYDSKYFLDFVENPDKMIAYAPSLGSTEIRHPIIRERTAALISRFTHLSVREQQGADLIKKLTDQDAKVVLDPTLLMNSSAWDARIQEDQVPKLQDEEYIICYFLGDADKYMDYVRMLSQKMAVPYYVIPVTAKQKKSRESVPFEVGPCEFVSLVRNAKYVVTDSFHGLAFSVNYNVPFSVFKRFEDNDPKNQNSRILNLLHMLGLEDRLVDYRNMRDAQLEFICNFTEANHNLIVKRKESIDYLKRALESAVSVQTDAIRTPFTITERCCGCGACAAVCAKNAITIAKNEEGFEHYFVDTDKCVLCGQCQTVCPMLQITAPHMKDSHALCSVKSCSQKTLEQSSSGGVGHDIAEYLLDEGYAVCGCMYDTATNSAKHIWIMPEEQDRLPLLQGSKYIQSISSEALKQIAKTAKDYKIAFFGTPCQAAGVDKLLRKKGLRDNAVIIDLICHGVPSYYLWETYLAKLDENYGIGSHPTVFFRSKEGGWRRRILLAVGNGRAYKKEEGKDDFYAFFRRGLCDMESCFDCPYREHSGADIRIGDYWGDKFIKDKQGVSMVISNTKCGEAVVKVLADKQVCRVDAQELAEYWSVQYPYNQQRPLIREQLIAELKAKKTDLHLLREKYCKYYDQTEKISRIIRLLKKIIKRG